VRRRGWAFVRCCPLPMPHALYHAIDIISLCDLLEKRFGLHTKTLSGTYLLGKIHLILWQLNYFQNAFCSKFSYPVGFGSVQIQYWRVLCVAIVGFEQVVYFVAVLSWLYHGSQALICEASNSCNQEYYHQDLLSASRGYSSGGVCLAPRQTLSTSITLYHKNQCVLDSTSEYSTST
jgi:hypothetical protein